MKKKNLVHIGILALILAMMLPQYHCANIIPPQGGPRDSLPPKLVTSTPKDSTKNFTGNKITFTFDEYIEVKDVQNNVIISPYPKNQPLIEGRLRNVTVKLKDSLEPNTTYTIQFGNSIVDINESNPFKNFSYVFSTGNSIDYETISGKLLVAETGKADSTLLVVLHSSNDDSAIVKDRPRYIARCDGEGNFTFYNLPTANFSIYAMKDVTGQKRYTSKKQLFAFANQRATAGKDKNLELFAYDEEKEVNEQASEKPDPANAKKDLFFTTNLEGDRQDLLSNLTISFNKKVTAIDSTKILFFLDSATKIDKPNWQLDSTGKKLTFLQSWQEDKPYRLILQKGFATDSLGKTYAKNDTIKFTTKGSGDYGSIRIRFLNLDMKTNPVLQLVQNNVIVFSETLSSNIWMKKIFKPGAYELRILRDANKNGRWDAGQFFGQRRQPEIVIAYDNKINIRSNWENEIDIK
jgi:hypothetical protein